MIQQKVSTAIVLAAAMAVMVVAATSRQSFADGGRVYLPLVRSAPVTEGELNVIALPHDWCNYGAVIEGFRRTYGVKVNELNPNAGSSDELQAIRDNKDGGALAPDVIDVGPAFGDLAKAEGLVRPYKVNTWATIPAGAKDADGYWYGDYFSMVAFMINKEVVPNSPLLWADLRKPEYHGQVALSGDPRVSNQAIQSVQAASLANGGTVENPMPGLEFFHDLYASGNLSTLIASKARVASGETPVAITWDYNALAGADSIGGDPPIAVIAPEDGLLAGFYVQAISAYAPHPKAARLWMEYLYSDAGQLAWMQGYCHPVREADLRTRDVVPKDIAAKMPDASGAIFPTSQQLANGKAIVVNNWDAVVGADIH